MGREKAFEGIKVVDFSWVLAGPSSAKELALNGATVVKVESHKRPDVLRHVGPYKDNVVDVNRSVAFATHNVNKFSVSLDLGVPKGREVAIKLVKWADVLIEGFTVGVMKQWGLDYKSASEVNPGIIYVSNNLQGQYGPHCTAAGFGVAAVALAGFSELTGWPDRGPVPVYGSYTDSISPYCVAVTIAAALAYRRRTGKGIYIDQSQFESGILLLEPAVLEYTANGRIGSRHGNRCPNAAPHGIYRCRGEDRWAAIAVFTDEEWKSFCKTIGSPAWTMEDRFSTLTARKENEDELDRLVEQWTRDCAAEEVMTMMQAAGVSAGVVKTMKDIFEDPHLKHTGGFTTLSHPEIGVYYTRTPAYKLSKTPWEFNRPAPCLGEHNGYVLKEILHLSDEEIANLLIEGVVTTDADVPGLQQPRQS